MIQLDEYIKSALQTIEVEHIPFSIMENGQIEVAQSRKFPIGCIVKTIDKFGINQNGTVDCTSVFYFFQEITNQGDAIGEINVKSEGVLKKVLAFIRALKSAPFQTNPQGDAIELTAYEMLTTAVETGLSFNITFRLSYSQCS